MNIGMTSLESLSRLRVNVKSKRWSSFDRTGGNADLWFIPAGETVVLGEAAGAGCIKHIWMTTLEDDPNLPFNLRRLILNMYWDGEKTPSVSCPLGDFFGLGHACGAYFSSLPLQASYLGLNCWFPMPYSEGAKITITNDTDITSLLYFYIDYQSWQNAEPDLARFHACWNRRLVVKKDEKMGTNAAGVTDRLNTSGNENFVVLDAKGRGHYVGCCLHLDTNETGWWGEGDDMFFIDGESWPPSLHGTGTEDYFCGAWNYNSLRQTYSTPYYGYSFKGNADYTGKHSQYRFHVEDPVFFDKSLLFSIEHGHANDRQGDWTSSAYWYQVGRKDPLPEIPPFEQRMPYAFGGLERGIGKDRRDLPV